MQSDRWIEEGGRALRRLGFKKRGNTWRREDEGGVSVVNLQHSRYGPDWYLNVGIHRHGLADPKIEDCGLPQRIKHANRDVTDVIDELVAWIDQEYAAYARGAAMRQVPTGPRQRARHVKFGPGTIIEDRGTSVNVEFDDGTTRLLTKAFIEMDPPEPTP